MDIISENRDRPWDYNWVPLNKNFNLEIILSNPRGFWKKLLLVICLLKMIKNYF